MDSLVFLEKPGKVKPQPVWAVHGDEGLLKRRALTALRAVVLGPDDAGMGLSVHAGDKAVWAAVHDDLQTLPFLSPRRLVLVENADPFVSDHRARLEKYVGEHPPGSTPPSGILVLELNSLPGNTRLAKLLGETAAIVCKAPKIEALPRWCAQWAGSQYGKTLPEPAARLLVDLIGPEMGLLDQELAKLAASVGSATRIEAADVDRLVGASRAEDVWKIFELMSTGRVGASLDMVNRLLDQGEEPLRLLGAFGYQLRRLAQAARLTTQGMSIQEAIEKVGIMPWARKSAEQQMRHLGRRRLDSLYDWLIETDFGIKGASSLPIRTQMERLVVRLARGRQP